MEIKRVMMKSELSLLKKIEWAGSVCIGTMENERWRKCCPACRNLKHDGHTKKCRLKRMIDERSYMVKIIKEQLRKR